MTQKNYRERHPTFSFRVDYFEKLKLDKLAVKNNLTTNEYARTIIKKFLNAELIEKTEDLQTEKIKLQIEKLKQEVAYMKIKTEFAENFHAPLSRSATISIKPSLIVETPNSVETIRSPYDESNKRLQCLECGCLFTWKSKEEFIEKMGEMNTHLMLKHDRKFNALERDVIEKLEYEGASI